MTDHDRPPHLDERGWRHDLSPQPRMIDRPLPWWRRYNRCDWAFVALCLAGAACCWWVITR